MAEFGRAGPRGGAFAGAWIALLACVALGGCVGPKAVQLTRMRYNEAFRATNDEQLLMNIVRLRYADSPVFIDLPSITSQFEVSGQGGYTGGIGNQFPGRTDLGNGVLNLRDTPTLSYHPREGREIARALLTPLSADLFSVVNAGANIQQLLLMTINDINDVPNAPQATVMVPRVAESNEEFVQGIRMLESLQDGGAVELAVQTTEEAEASSDPIAAGHVLGRDVLAAAKDGYVYRAGAGGEMSLRKRERGLVLKVRPQYVHSPQMEALARAFRVTPGLGRYKIKSELAGDAENRPPNPLGEDTVYLNMRSILQIMIFLSKGVCVPAEHVAEGVAPTTFAPDGSPYDWTRVTAGNFFVASQKHRPRGAEVAVHYRGYWFWIDRSDVNSRAVLAILEILFSLQESDGKNVGPLLTLPIGG
jgi:hypothetical protein